MDAWRSIACFSDLVRGRPLWNVAKFSPLPFAVEEFFRLAEVKPLDGWFGVVAYWAPSTFGVLIAGNLIFALVARRMKYFYLALSFLTVFIFVNGHALTFQSDKAWTWIYANTDLRLKSLLKRTEFCTSVRGAEGVCVFLQRERLGLFEVCDAGILYKDSRIDAGDGGQVFQNFLKEASSEAGYFNSTLMNDGKLAVYRSCLARSPLP
jgi:hypothetical protein